MKLWPILLLATATLFACSRPPAPEAQQKPGPKIEYQDLKPETWPVPEEVKAALPGLQNDNLYVYRDVSPTVNLVASLPQYARKDAIERCARAFTALTRDPKLAAGIDFWIIQVQPEEGNEVLVWGVRPAEAQAYAQTGDLNKFFTESEYLLVDDKIIPAGPERAAYLNPPP